MSGPKPFEGSNALILQTRAKTHKLEEPMNREKASQMNWEPHFDTMLSALGRIRQYAFKTSSTQRNLAQISLNVTTCIPHPYFCKTSPYSFQCETRHRDSKEEIKLLYMFCVSKLTNLNITIYYNILQYYIK